jgi:hypothetical protein
MANIKRANTSGITKTGTAISDVPDAPTIGTATAGAAGSGQATVTYTAAATGGAVTTFTATSSPGSVTGTGASPITVSGLTLGTAYTFTVRGANSTGTSPASAASNSITATEIAQAGYIMGGYTVESTTRRSSIQKITFSSDTVSTIAATFDTQRSSGAGMANSGTAAYNSAGVAGGGSHTRRIDKLNFAADTISNTVANMSSGASAATNPAAMANSGTAGYIAGGDKTDGGVSYRTSIDKLTFSNDTISVLGATLSVMQMYWSGSANSGTAGYYSGGYNNGELGIGSTIVKLLFSNETRSNLAATINANINNNTSHANSGTASYWLGGFVTQSAITGAISKLPFSTESRSTLGVTITARDMLCGFSKSGTAGYTAFGTGRSGGYGSQNSITGVEKLAYSNDTISTGISLSYGGSFASGAANSGTL